MQSGSACFRKLIAAQPLPRTTTRSRCAFGGGLCIPRNLFCAAYLTSLHSSFSTMLPACNAPTAAEAARVALRYFMLALRQLTLSSYSR